MDKIFVDTSVIIRYLKSADGILADILDHYKLVTSVVTITELMASTKASQTEAHKKMEDFVNDNFEIAKIDEKVANLAGDLIRSLGLTLAHAQVAATAITMDLPLLTYEIKTFDKVPNLKLIDI